MRKLIWWLLAIALLAYNLWPDRPEPLLGYF